MEYSRKDDIIIININVTFIIRPDNLNDLQGVYKMRHSIVKKHTL